MIFVDTWAWIALASRRDQYHAVASALHRRLARERRTYVTTDFVLSELITQLYRILAVSEAEAFIDTGRYRLVHVSDDQFRRSWAMRRKYSDKPGISFVDLTSMVVMLDLGLSDIFTGDAHFRQVGLGFQLFPSTD